MMDDEDYDDEDAMDGDDEDEGPAYDDDAPQLEEVPSVALTPHAHIGIRLRDKALDFITRYPNVINNIRYVFTSLIEFKKDLNPTQPVNTMLFRSVDTIFHFIDSAKSNTFQSYYSLLSAKKGYLYLTHKGVNIGFLFIDILDQFPQKVIKFLDGTFVTQFTLPMGDIFLYSYSSEQFVYYNKNKVEVKKLLEFLVAEKLKSFDSNFLLYQKDEDKPTYSISASKPLILGSQLAEEQLAHIKQFATAGHHRSILLYGPPGTGKSSLSYKICSELNLRTLVFNASYTINNTNVIDYVIDVFGIEAIIIDDFDQYDFSNKKLELLEMLNRRLKVVIGVANSLKEFHPAMLRPGRFDEVLLVKELDKSTIDGVLSGVKLSAKAQARVKFWPIAYIQELAKRAKFSNARQLKQHIEELDERVYLQLVKLGMNT